MKLEAICKIIIVLFISALTACYVKPEPRQQFIEPVNKKSIQNVIRQKERFACDYSELKDIGWMVNSYIRNAKSYADLEYSAQQYSQARQKEYSIVKRFISPEYLDKYYIQDLTAVIGDVPVAIRNPELICIKRIAQNKFQALVFEYNSNSNAHVSIDKMAIDKIGNNYVFVPFGEPKEPHPNEAIWAQKLGATNWPTTNIFVTRRIYREAM